MKESKELPKTIESRNISKLFKYIYKRRNLNKDINSFSYKILVRDIAILEILFSTGLRVSEVSSIKSNNINIKTGYIKVFGKGSKERIIHICNSEIKEILREYVSLFKNEIEKNDWFFINRLGNRFSEQSITNMIKKYQKKSGIIQELTPHMFRHSFATLLLEKGVDIRYIQNFLGHASISTTQIYTQVNEVHKKKILRTKHPRMELNFLD
ncbi:tyrosine-type recombinase/integrase [Arcobacter sp. LA11]|uniref:tyrosine-type recombinase/integrase n=1 Tax=Arcobacter sp. LA11 TaxID=1898176 RepID=UPI0035CCE4C8